MTSEFEDVRWLEAAGDSMGLLARAFAAPDAALAEALAEGAVRRDAISCAEDLDAAAEMRGPADALAAFEGAEAEALLASLRRAHSVLYMVPGSDERIFPFEGAFRFVAEGRPGKPLIFSNRAAVDVEECMRAVGLQPDESRHEPADSLWFELAFLAHLYGALAQTRAEGADGSELVGAIETFQANHVRPWMEAFMDATRKKAPSVEGAQVYGALAQVASVVLGAVL